MTRACVLAPGGALAPLLDAETIANLRALDDGGDGFLADLIGVFHAESPGRVADIRRVSEANAHRELVAAVHALKGSAGALGLLRLADLCQQIESAANDGCVAEAAMLQRLEAEFAAASRALSGLGPFAAG